MGTWAEDHIPPVDAPASAAAQSSAETSAEPEDTRFSPPDDGAQPADLAASLDNDEPAGDAPDGSGPSTAQLREIDAEQTANAIRIAQTHLDEQEIQDLDSILSGLPRADASLVLAAAALVAGITTRQTLKNMADASQAEQLIETVRQAADQHLSGLTQSIAAELTLAKESRNYADLDYRTAFTHEQQALEYTQAATAETLKNLKNIRRYVVLWAAIGTGLGVAVGAAAVILYRHFT
jgi:hypothetical protein